MKTLSASLVFLACAGGEPLAGHPGGITQAAFSPDGSLLAAGGSAPVVTVWDVAARKVRYTLKGAGNHGILAFRPDGKVLATGGTDGKVRVWDLADGTLAAIFDHVPSKLPLQYVYGLAWSPDGSLLASSGAMHSVIRIWNPATSRLERSLGTHGSTTFCIAFSPDAASLLAGSEDGKVRVFNLARGLPTSEVAAHAGGVRALAFSPDGKTVATAGVDKAARLWDFVDGTLSERRALPGHTDMILGLTFRKDGQELATASADGGVRIWDAVRGTERRILHRGRRGARAVAYGTGEDMAVGLWTLGTLEPNVLLYGAGTVTGDPH